MSYLNKQGKKIAVIGSRNFTDKNRLYEILDKNFDKIKVIVSGGCRGADELARQYAQDKGLPVLIFYPKWYDKDGNFNRGAGFSRNIEIIKSADVVIAFTCGSKGTAHSIQLAKDMGKPLKVFLFNPSEPESQSALPEDSPELKPEQPKSALPPRPAPPLSVREPRGSLEKGSLSENEILKNVISQIETL